MRDVIYALLPATGAALYYFGISAILLLGASIAGAVAAEWLFASRESRGASLSDATGVLTGLLLGLTLPPGFPLWMAFLGGAFGIGFAADVAGDDTVALPGVPLPTRATRAARGSSAHARRKRRDRGLRYRSASHSARR